MFKEQSLKEIKHIFFFKYAPKIHVWVQLYPARVYEG